MLLQKKVFKGEKTMKKLLSVLLVAAMLVTTLVVAVVNVSAADGDWSVYAIKSQYLDGYADIKRSVPGLAYVDDGLTMVTVTRMATTFGQTPTPTLPSRQKSPSILLTVSNFR
jgi:hypothetical protein